MEPKEILQVITLEANSYKDLDKNVRAKIFELMTETCHNVIDVRYESYNQNQSTVFVAHIYYNWYLTENEVQMYSDQYNHKY